MTKLAEIEGIGEVYSKKLEEGGISSIEQLLEACAEKKDVRKWRPNVISVKSWY